MKTRNFLLLTAASLMLTFLFGQYSSAQNNPPERVFVFARTTGARVNYLMFNGKSWQPWAKLDGIILGAPDACSPNPGEIIILARGQGGASEQELFYKIFKPSGTSKPWESFRTKFGSDPGVACRSGGKVDVFVRGYDNPAAWWAWYENGVWAWLPIGGVHAGGPDATRTADNRIDVFSRGADDALWHTSVTYKGNIPDIKNVPAWESLGGHILADPTAVGVNW